MINIATSPGLDFDCLQIMRLVQDIEFKIAGNETVIALGIKANIKQLPAKQIVKELKEMATDNYIAIVDLLGFNLTNKILKV